MLDVYFHIYFYFRTQHAVLSGQMWSVSVLLPWYLSPANHKLCMHATKCPHHHLLTLRLVWGRTQALTVRSCPRSSKSFLLFLCQILQSKEKVTDWEKSLRDTVLLSLCKDLVIKHNKLPQSSCNTKF